jgi:hypothetical protein
MRMRILFLVLCVGVALAGDPPRGFVGLTPSVEAKPAKGIAIGRVVPGGPADKAGLKVGDVLLRYDGQDVPDFEDVDATDDDALEAYFASFRKIAEQVKAGAEVEIVVERDGKPVTLRAIAVDEAALAKLQPEEKGEEREEGEEGGEEKAKLPDPASAGEPTAASFDFEKDPSGARLFAANGKWEVVAEERSDPANHVLRQGAAVQPWAVCLFAGKGCWYSDGVAKVRFLPVSGAEDASGGIVFRAQDARNCYVMRANALEGNFRIYVIKAGARTQLASVTVEPPAPGKWHTLEVSFQGPAFKATLDGKAVVEAKDETFKSGWCGLWTKADSVTLFDDLEVRPGEGGSDASTH